MEDIVYQLADGRYWDVQSAKYVYVPQEGRSVVPLYANGHPAGEDYLIATLRFYGFPLGILASQCPEAIKEQLAALDAQYLTPRVLAGLATGDEYAAEQWAAHEAEAAPLRENLAELESR